MKTPGNFLVIVMLLFCYSVLGQSTPSDVPVPPVWGDLLPPDYQTVSPPGVSLINLSPTEALNPGLYDPILLTPVIPVRQVFWPVSQPWGLPALQSQEKVKEIKVEVYNYNPKSSMFKSPYQKQ